MSRLESIPGFSVHNLVPKMAADTSKYLSLADKFECDHEDIEEFTKKVLAFWAKAAKQELKGSAWLVAARITFALSPNSASCERVFSLLKQFYGEQRDSSLADQIEVSLMLAFNGRSVG